VPGTAARSVWICRQATRLAYVSICPGRRSPSMSFTSFSSSTRQLTQCVAKKSKGPRSGGVHAISGSRTSTLGVTARKPGLRNSSAETSRHTVASGSRRRYASSSTALRARCRPSRSSTDGTAGRAVAARSRSKRWPRRLRSIGQASRCVRFQAHQRPCRGGQFPHPGRQSQGPRLRDHQTPDYHPLPCGG